MAIYEKNGQMTYVDEAGNEYLLFPNTKIGRVEGLEDALAGKAPAGYGYGDPITITISNTQTGDELDFDTALEDVFSGMDNYSARQVQFQDFSSGVGDVFTGTLYKNWADYGWLKGTSYSGYTMQKVKKNGAWHNREWINPPMVLGVEYRTTERWNGKPVYAYAYTFGNLPASGHLTAEHGRGKITPIRCFGTALNTDYNFSASVASLGGVDNFYADDANTHIIVDSDLSSYVADVAIFYVKD